MKKIFESSEGFGLRGVLWFNQNISQPCFYKTQSWKKATFEAALYMYRVLYAPTTVNTEKRRHIVPELNNTVVTVQPANATTSSNNLQNVWDSNTPSTSLVRRSSNGTHAWWRSGVPGKPFRKRAGGTLRKREKTPWWVWNKRVRLGFGMRTLLNADSPMGRDDERILESQRVEGWVCIRHRWLGVHVCGWKGRWNKQVI